jgi:putative queuosine salvage protein
VVQRTNGIVPASLDDVRTAAKAVAARARHVAISYPRIAGYAASVPFEQVREPVLDPTRHYFGTTTETIAYVFTLDAINFGSGYFPRLRKRSGMSGYFTVATSLADYYREHGPLSAGQLADISVEECAKIFGQDLADNAVQELMSLFRTALNDLGRYLLRNFDGSFSGLLQSAQHSAARLVELLTEMPYFNDVQRHEDLRVPFYKRAQLTAADLSLALQSDGLGRFHDLERLTIFADNLVPHVLRVDGILLYDPALAARIDHEALIPSGSREEVEIRACAVHAVELLTQELRRHGRDVCAMSLDYFLWNRGQQPSYKARPRHRTRTVFY